MVFDRLPLAIHIDHTRNPSGPIRKYTIRVIFRSVDTTAFRLTYRINLERFPAMRGLRRRYDKFRFGNDRNGLIRHGRVVHLHRAWISDRLRSFGPTWDRFYPRAGDALGRRHAVFWSLGLTAVTPIETVRVHPIRPPRDAFPTLGWVVRKRLYLRTTSQIPTKREIGYYPKRFINKALQLIPYKLNNSFIYTHLSSLFYRLRKPLKRTPSADKRKRLCGEARVNFLTKHRHNACLKPNAY